MWLVFKVSIDRREIDKDRSNRLIRREEGIP